MPARRVQGSYATFGGFTGFGNSGDGVHLPTEFFTDLLPAISHIDELQVTLVALRQVAKGDESVAISEYGLLHDDGLRKALRTEGSPRSPEDRILHGLELALARGTLLRVIHEYQRREESWYYLSSPRNRAMVAAFNRNDKAVVAKLPDDHDPPLRMRPDRPNAFRLYEQNIGPLTPLIADQIIRAIEDYPDDWIEDAMREAVAYNRRSWRYISRILENWMANGRPDDQR